jgi:hypothetical protein
MVVDGNRTSVALGNLRGVVILIVLAFHSVLAYVRSARSEAFPFDAPPFAWRAFPILDSHRWFGFDLFCAWQDVHLMALMFFLSALFTWPSLRKKGSRKFLGDRSLRLGIPFAFALAIVMPLALYPTYRVTATDPGLIAYAQHYLALPFWPNGPMWFLWQLLLLTALAATLYRLFPQRIERLLLKCASAATLHPGGYFGGLVAMSAVAYVPLALIFTAWTWSDRGPFALQLCRPLIYAVFYFAGLGIGAGGLERGLLRAQGDLARRWKFWLISAVSAILSWMGLMGLAMRDATASLGLRTLVDLSFAVACASCCFVMLAACLRFGTGRSNLMNSLSVNAFGMYLLHYPFAVWLQYAVLDWDVTAVVKAGIVFGGTVCLAWGTTNALRRIPFGAPLIGERLPAIARRPAQPDRAAISSGSEQKCL